MKRFRAGEKIDAGSLCYVGDDGLLYQHKGWGPVGWADEWKKNQFESYLISDYSDYRRVVRNGIEALSNH